MPAAPVTARLRSAPPPVLLPPYYVLLPAFAVLLSLLTWLQPRTGLLQVAVLASAGIGGVLLANDALLFWHRGVALGRLTLNLGMFYWLWTGAIERVLSDPPFQTPDPIYPGFRDVVPDSIVATSLLCVNLFALAAQLGWRYMPQPQRVLRALADRLDPLSSRSLDVLAVAMASVAWIPVLIAYDWEWKTALGDLLLMRSAGQVGPTQSVGVEHHLRLIGLFGGAFAVARIVLHVRGIRWLRYLAVAISVPIAYFGDGSRFNFGFMVLPALLILGAPLAGHISWRKRRRMLGLLLVVTLLLVAYQGAVRMTGFGGDSRRPSSIGQMLRDGVEGHDQFGPLLIAVNVTQEEGHFFTEPMTPFFFTQFVPREFWPGKPDPVAWQTFNDAWTQGGSFNVTPSITGQYYMNWGYFGVVYIGLFIGWLAHFCESWFSRLQMGRQLLSATVAGLLLAFVYFSFRIYHPMYFAYPLFGYLVYRLFTRPVPR
jgi:hypothetical protein